MRTEIAGCMVGGQLRLHLRIIDRNVLTEALERIVFIEELTGVWNSICGR